MCREIIIDHIDQNNSDTGKKCPVCKLVYTHTKVERGLLRRGLGLLARKGDRRGQWKVTLVIVDNIPDVIMKPTEAHCLAL